MEFIGIIYDSTYNDIYPIGVYKQGILYGTGIITGNLKKDEFQFNVYHKLEKLTNTFKLLRMSYIDACKEFLQKFLEKGITIDNPIYKKQINGKEVGYNYSTLLKSLNNTINKHNKKLNKRLNTLKKSNDSIHIKLEKVNKALTLSQAHLGVITLGDYSDIFSDPTMTRLNIVYEELIIIQSLIENKLKSL